jgi:UTP--glucose-1-phosphate uridylyltransferase
VGDEPFFVHLADDLIDAEVPCLKQMAATFRSAAAACSASRKCRSAIPTSTASSRSSRATASSAASRASSRSPSPRWHPSTLAVVGRYVLTPTIFEELERVGQGAGGEIQLTDGIARLLQREPVYAHRFTGRRFDCGSKLGYLQATVELSLAHPVLGKDFAPT